MNLTDMDLTGSGAGPLLLALAGGYLVGSIPFGVIATRLGGADDVRSVGSGNIGATNVLRTGRRDLAAITLAGDAGKGAVAAILAGWLVPPPLSSLAAAVAGGAAFVGHLFPVWLRFRGGKGLATFFGILFALVWPVGIASAVTWILVAAIFRISSLAGLATAALAPFYLIFLFHLSTEPLLWLIVGMAVLIFIRHHQNIRRLFDGTEPRIGAVKAPAVQ